MSANNYIEINLGTYKVLHRDVDIPSFKQFVGKGVDIKDAIGIAEDFTEEIERDGGYIEYGIRFTGTPKQTKADNGKIIGFFIREFTKKTHINEYRAVTKIDIETVKEALEIAKKLTIDKFGEI